ncbi:MAG: cellulose binding domain-containing protein, partial [Planctomycetales bacterium]
MVLGPFNGNPIQQHETPLAELIVNVSTDFLETRLPDPEEDPNQMIGTWMQDPIGGLQISNAHLYCDAVGLFLGEKLGVVGGQGDVGYVVTSHRMDDSGTPVVNVIDGFDPTTDKLDFQYFSNREFAIADSADGVVISASPQAYNAWGEKTLLRGVTFSQLTEENFIFRFEQKYEDGFNRFGGTSENTPTDGTRDIPVVSSPLGNQNSGDGVTSGSDFSYEIANTWDAGYVSQWTYAPQSAVGSWQVTLQIDGEITSVWNAEILSQDSGTYVIGNADFNGGLATGQTTAFGFDASGSSGSIQILSGSVQQNPSQDDDATTTTGWETHIIGDSIAVGLQYQNPAALGYALVGSTPTTIYNEILAGGYQLQGARVLLSSGIMNNTIDFAGVENQLQYLTAQGASVRLVGAADGNYDSHNQQLATLAEQYGVTFMGGFTPGTDGVHPPDYQYADLYAVVSQMDSSEHGDLPDDGMDMITGVLSGFGTILNDDVAAPVAPPVDEDPVTPPMDDHDDHVDPPPSSGDYI